MTTSVPSTRDTPRKDVPYRPWPSTDSRRCSPASQPTMQRSKSAVRERAARDEEKRRRGRSAAHKERSGAYASDLPPENAPLSRKAFSHSSSIGISRFERKGMRRPLRHARGVPHVGQNFAPGGNAAPHPAQKPPPILLPHARQNFEPAGTEAPHAGHAMLPEGAWAEAAAAGAA